MDYFHYKGDEAYCEEVPLRSIYESYGSPTYVYSLATLKRHCERLFDAFSSYRTMLCFAVKANSSIAYLKEVFSSGYGADVVSVGELERSLKAGIDPKKIVFSGVGKRAEEMTRAMKLGIYSFNVESAFELDLLAEISSSLNCSVNICLRVNPDIDAKTNPKITTGLDATKFGMRLAQIEPLLPIIRDHKQLNLVGVACHIGSQMIDMEPLKNAASFMVRMAGDLVQSGFPIKLINMGGGLGIKYRDEVPPSLDEYANVLLNAIRPTGLQLVIEPGRVVAGNTGVLLSSVIGVKSTESKNFIILDGSMTEFMRPAFYNSYHDIEPVKSDLSGNGTEIFDFVGPVCESSDVLGLDRSLHRPQAGDLFYIRGCGAYGASMASNYNSRVRPCEVMVDGSTIDVIKEREALEDLWRLERF